MSPVDIKSPAAPEAILFDWDNTLVDVWPAIHEAINTTFAAMDHETWTLEETKGRVRKSLRDSFPEMFGDRWQEARRIFYKRYGEIHMEFLSPLPGAHEVLTWLAEQDIYLGVVSNKSGKYLRAEAEALGWNDYFGRIIGATDAEQDKPAEAPVRMALDGSGIEAGAGVWFVGDAAIDVQCAINSGLTPLIVMHEDTERELARHNLVQFVKTECRLRGMGALKMVVEDLIFPMSNK